MRKVLAIAAVGLALSVSLAPVAGAQGGGGGRGQRGMGGGGGLALLTIKDVQTELKMTEPQVAKIAEKQQEMQGKMQELFQGGGAGGERPSREEMQARQAKIRELQSKAVNDILDTKQQKRFAQLEYQSMGVSGASQRKEVADALNITEDQRTKMREIQQAQFEELRNSGGAGFGPDATPEERAAMMKKFQDLQKAANEKIVTTVLTDAQKTKWKELIGEPVKFSLAPQGGFGRRPGGAGGNPPAPAG
jgi:hypothetical protein